MCSVLVRNGDVYCSGEKCCLMRMYVERWKKVVEQAKTLNRL
jgi:hypothetical protein